MQNLDLQDVLEDIGFEAERIARAAELSAYRRLGGIVDPQVDHLKLIADLGVKKAAVTSAKFVKLRADMRRLYLLNPVRMVEHAGLLQRGFRRGWFRRSNV